MTMGDNGKAIKKELISIFFLSVALMFGVLLSAETAEYVTKGLKLAIECVIPSSFPFMIISDLYVCYGNPENIRLLKKAFTRIFGLPAAGLAPFICGNIGGFPIGAKMVSDSHRAGLITKDEAHSLIPLCNNPSCAFIVGGVGLGIYGDIKIGILFLLSVYAATFLCGILVRCKRNKNHFAEENARQNYSFVESVKSAGLSSVSIISFISVFSVINGIVKKHIKFMPFIYLFSAFSEVTNAVKIFSDISALPRCLSLSLSAFSLGFGGICVGMQSAVFATSSGLKMRKYYLIKLLEGVLSASIFTLLFMTIK